MRSKILLPVLALALLSGCVMGPNYQRPKIEMPGEFRGAPAPNAGETVSIADTKWQDLFPDPVLNGIVSRALLNNFDLGIAAERIEQARAQLGIVRANQLPFLDVQSGLTASRSSSIGSNNFVAAGTPLRATYTAVGAALNWELDLWGRLRRQSEAARASYLASQDAQRGVMVSLVGGVMDSYFQLLEQDLELEISKRTAGSARDSLRIVQLRRERGAASGLDVQQAQQLVFTAGATMAAAERAIQQTENQLSLLQGSVPTAQSRGRKLDDIPVPAQAPPGLPSELLERRPDIRQAEQNLVAANAQIGAARALYFPQISLTAFAGGQSRYLSDIASAPARVYTVAPSAVQAIFHGGQIRNQVKLSEAQKCELLVVYQQAIYTALREVSDALVGFDRFREQRNQQQQLVKTLEETVRLSELRYRGGLDSYLQVLDAQRNLFTSQLELSRLSLQERSAVVQIYRSLGGGWQ
jgi:NodT family efflux transporter outer membrane factor (OMF) lipoprotein